MFFNMVFLNILKNSFVLLFSCSILMFMNAEGGDEMH